MTEGQRLVTEGQRLVIRGSESLDDRRTMTDIRLTNHDETSNHMKVVTDSLDLYCMIFMSAHH